jgi:hypothetical protein
MHLFFEVWRMLIDPILVGVDPKLLGSKSYTMRSSIDVPGGTVDCTSVIGGGHGLRLGVDHTTRTWYT